MKPGAHVTLAPYPVRLRLALTGLMLAWLLAALFLLLGWRAATRASSSQGANGRSAVTAPMSVNPQLAVAGVQSVDTGR
jgi:hypothetical protein